MRNLKKLLEKVLIVMGGVLLLNIFLCGICAAGSFSEGRRSMKSILITTAFCSSAGYAVFTMRAERQWDVYGFGALGCFLIMAVLLGIWSVAARWFWKKRRALLTQITQEDDEAENTSTAGKAGIGARIAGVALQGLNILWIIVIVGGLFVLPLWLGPEGLVLCVAIDILLFISIGVTAAIWPLIALLFWRIFFKSNGKFRDFSEFFGAATKNPGVIAERV